AAGAGAPAAAVGADAPLVGLTSGGVGDGVQAATNPEIITTATSRLLSRTMLAIVDSLPFTLLPRARRAAFQTRDSEQQAHPDAFAPRPVRSHPAGRANGSWHASDGCLHAPPRRRPHGMGTGRAAIRRSSRCGAGPSGTPASRSDGRSQ